MTVRELILLLHSAELEDEVRLVVEDAYGQGSVEVPLRKVETVEGTVFLSDERD